MSKQRKPIWQPIGMLPTYAEMIDSNSADVEEHYAMLLEIRDHPHVIHRASLASGIKLTIERRDLLLVVKEQLTRWQSEPMTTSQRQELERLNGQLERLFNHITAFLGLSKQIAQVIKHGLASERRGRSNAA